MHRAPVTFGQSDSAVGSLSGEIQGVMVAVGRQPATASGTSAQQSTRQTTTSPIETPATASPTPTMTPAPSSPSTVWPRSRQRSGRGGEVRVTASGSCIPDDDFVAARRSQGQGLVGGSSVVRPCDGGTDLDHRLSFSTGANFAGRLSVWASSQARRRRRCRSSMRSAAWAEKRIRMRSTALGNRRSNGASR